VGGGRGQETERKGGEVYGRREKRGWEAGEKGKNNAILRNFSQSKNKEAENNKYRAGTGIKGY